MFLITGDAKGTGLQSTYNLTGFALQFLRMQMHGPSCSLPLEEQFLKHPDKLAEYVHGLTTELHQLGLTMIQESLEMMNRMLLESSIRRCGWVVEIHIQKQLNNCLLAKLVYVYEGIGKEHCQKLSVQKKHISQRGRSSIRHEFGYTCLPEKSSCVSIIIVVTEFP